MVDYTYTYTAAKLQAHHDRVENLDSEFEAVQVENRLKGNQLPVVEGNVTLPDAMPRDYSAGDEIAAGWFAVTDLFGVTFTDGLWKGTSGEIQRSYGRDAAGLISKSTEYAGVKLHDDTQLTALIDVIATNGCRITDDVDNVYVTFDLATFPNGVKFPFIAAEVGSVPDIGDDEAITSISIDLINSRDWQDESLNRALGVAYTNTDKVTRQVYAAITVGTASAISISWSVNSLIIPGPNVIPTVGNIITTPAIDVPPGDLYSLSKFGGDPSDVLSWYELEK